MLRAANVTKESLDGEIIGRQGLAIGVDVIFRLSYYAEGFSKPDSISKVDATDSVGVAEWVLTSFQTEIIVEIESIDAEINDNHTAVNLIQSIDWMGGR